MQSNPISSNNNATSMATLPADQIIEIATRLLDQNTKLSIEVTELRDQLAWFKRQLFGQKSERRVVEPSPDQGFLGESFAALPESPLDAKTSSVQGHTRKAKTKSPSAADESTLFFDEDKVPIETIRLEAPEVVGLSAGQYEVISEKVSYRLAQRPGSFVVLKYLRPVIKLRDEQTSKSTLHCAPAPAGVLEGSRADVSFIAGMLIDKLVYHLPLHRQHQRGAASGLKVSRQWYTQLAQSSIAMLEPIAEAQLDSIRQSRVIAMDETPIKAGVVSPGKMRSAFFWPVYGLLDEINFAYYPDRKGRNVLDALGLSPPEGGVLLSDGYSAYASYAKKTGLTHAQCWAHTRRNFFEAQQNEPQEASQALEIIGQLYEIEELIREKKLSTEAKLAVRQTQSKPIVDKFFKWIDKQFENQGFLPRSLLTKALAYAKERADGLQVFLNDAEVPIDTNHVERALRAIPMGKKNWMFCWTELGAQHIGIMQSLLVTCKLQDINPYDYLVDVLQRVSIHPQSKVHELTPRHWKKLFADNPLRSDLHRFTKSCQNAA
jgi:transposase